MVTQLGLFLLYLFARAIDVGVARWVKSGQGNMSSDLR